jgi:soluble lytic murein transglycosylase-like protein
MIDAPGSDRSAQDPATPRAGSRRHRAAASLFERIASSATTIKLVAAAAFITLVAGSQAFAARLDRPYREPSEAQLRRLADYERYIGYFSSLPYGPSQSRVSPEYIRALILTESAAYRLALSNKGARGLTQIMPETGRLAVYGILASGIDYDYVDERRLANYKAEVLYDPAVNILIACYLGALYHADYSGRVELMAAAWNAGPQAVARHGYRTPPYEETQGMVHRVVGFLNYFSANSLATAGASVAAPKPWRYRNPAHQRWDTTGWDQPGWDERRIDWSAKF